MKLLAHLKSHVYISTIFDIISLPMLTMASKRKFVSEFSDDMSPAKSQKMNRNFKDCWKVGNQWLRYDAKTKSMFCDMCVKTQKSNTFTVGCTVLKKENVTRHASNKEHLAAVSAMKERLNMQVAREQAHSKSEAAVTAALRNVYFAAQHNLASQLIPDLNGLLIEQGVAQLSDLNVDKHTSYSHSTSIADFQESIAGVLEDQMLSKLKESSRFSLMFDESTDVSVHQNLIVYVRILETDALGYFEPHTYFLGIEELDRANADSIFGKVMNMLDSKGIDLTRLCGVSTDGAAVMVGNRSGVVTRLKAQVPGVLATHCIAHRLALSCCTGADSIPYLVKYQEIVNSIFKYFHYSPKHMSMLETVQSLTPGQSSRFKQVFHTRWLSFEASVDAMVTNFSSVISVFLEESSGKALSLHKSLTCFKFLYVTHFLSDVLKPLVILSKMYQKSDIDYSEVNPLLSSTISRLEDLRNDKSGKYLKEFLDVVPSEPQVGDDGLYTFDFQGHTIRDSLKQRQEAAAVCDKFVTGMVNSLNTRFSDNEDAAVLTSLSNLFNPGIGHSLKKGDLDTVSDYLGQIGMCGYREELDSFLSFAHTFVTSGSKSVSCTKDMVNLANKHRDLYPAACEAGQRLLVAPVSTADCERGFSKQNLIKTCLRNSMSNRALENLMRIGIDGPSRCDFDFSKAFKKWAGQKSIRRILS